MCNACDSTALRGDFFGGRGITIASNTRAMVCGFSGSSTGVYVLVDHKALQGEGENIDDTAHEFLRVSTRGSSMRWWPMSKASAT